MKQLRALVLTLTALAGLSPAGGQGDHRAWQELPGSSTYGYEDVVAPGPRFGQASLTVSSEKHYWEFGGQDETGTLLNQLWSYDFTYDIWEPRHESWQLGAPAPSPRAYATLVKLGTYMYLYGGMCEPHAEPAGGKPCSDDFWVYSSGINEPPWTAISYVGGEKPPPRSGHIALTHGSSMYVHGGSGGATYAREADYAPKYAEVVWEFRFTARQWVAHTPSPGTVTPLSAYGRAAALLLRSNRPILAVHGGIHHCRGKCVTPTTGTTLDIHSYVLSEMYWFDLSTDEWTRFNLTVQPSKAFHALYSHRTVDGSRKLIMFGGWGHGTTNIQQGEYQMQGNSTMQSDLWQLKVEELTLTSNWEKVVPASNTLPAPRMASGGGYLSGGAPSFVVAGGLGCANSSDNDLYSCSTVLNDLWSFDLWGWIAREGTVIIRSTRDGRPYAPDSLMLLEGESVEGERKAVSDAYFREVRTGLVVGLIRQYGMVMASSPVELDSGNTITIELTPAGRISHLFRLLQEDGATAISAARVTLEVWDPMLKQDFEGGWRSYQPLLSDVGGELFTNIRGEFSVSLHPTEWEGIPHQLASRYRLTCWSGQHQVYQDTELTVPQGSEPVERDLISAANSFRTFSSRLPQTPLDAGERGEAVKTGGQLRPYAYVYLDLYYDIVRPGQAAVVQVLTLDQPDNAFALFADEADKAQYPGPEHVYAYAACEDGRGTGMQADPLIVDREYPVCRMQWTFPRATADFHVRVAVVLAATVGQETATTSDTAAYQVEVFYEDLNFVDTPFSPDEPFTKEEADAGKAGVDLVVLAVSLSLGIGTCAGCLVLLRLATKRRKLRKYEKLKVRDLLLFNRPNAEIDKLVAHEMDAAMRTAPKVQGQQEMIPIPQHHAPPEEDNPYGYMAKRGQMPLGLRAAFGTSASEDEETPNKKMNGVAGFMGNLEAMAEEYRRGLLGGPSVTAAVSKAEAESTLAARYANLAAERDAAAKEGLPGGAVVMPKAPPRAPPGIAPPSSSGGNSRPGSARSTRPLVEPTANSQISINLADEAPVRSTSRPVSASSNPATKTPPRAPKGIHPPATRDGSRPASGVPQSSWLTPALRHPQPAAPPSSPPTHPLTSPSTSGPEPPRVTQSPFSLREQYAPTSLHQRRQQGPVLAPPPPAGLAAAVWVPQNAAATSPTATSPTSPPNAIRSPPPAARGPNRAPPRMPPPRVGQRTGQRAGALAPLNRHDMSEEELVARRLRALQGEGGGRGLTNTGRPGARRPSGR